MKKPIMEFPLKPATQIKLSMLIIEQEIGNILENIRRSGSERDGGPTVFGDKIRHEANKIKGRMEAIEDLIKDVRFK